MTAESIARHREQTREWKRSNSNRRKFQCANSMCGKTFGTYRTRRKFCSHSCAIAHSKADTVINWDDPKQRRKYFAQRTQAYRDRLTPQKRKEILEKVKCYYREKRTTNRDAYNAYKRVQSNKRYHAPGGKEAQAIRSRRWYQKNLEKGRALLRRKRYRRRGCAGTHTTEDWMQKVLFWGWRCWLCSVALTLKTLTQDHVIPVSKGGTNWLANLRPACKSCNSAKRDKKLHQTRY